MRRKVVMATRSQRKLSGGNPPSSGSSAEEELEELSSRKWSIPVFLPVTMEKLLSQCIAESYPSTEHRKNMIYNMTPQNVRLLTEMISLMVELISDQIIEDVVPKLVSTVGSLNRGENVYVTEEEMAECLGNSVDYGLKAALGLHSQPGCVFRIRSLIAAEVANRVNGALALLAQVGKLDVKPPVHLMNPQSLITRFAIILRLAEPRKCEAEDCPGTNADPNIPGFLSENQDWARTECEEDFSPDCCGSLDVDLQYSEEQLLHRDRYFIAAFLQRLFSCIAKAAGEAPQLFISDLRRLCERLEEKTVGRLSRVFPKKVEKIHKKVYRQLVREFFSAERLAHAMFTGDQQFEEHLVRILKEHLQNPENSRAAPPPPPPPSYYENMCEENGALFFSYSPTWKHKSSNIRRTFCSVAKFLRKLLVP